MRVCPCLSSLSLLDGREVRSLHRDDGSREGAGDKAAARLPLAHLGAPHLLHCGHSSSGDRPIGGGAGLSPTAVWRQLLRHFAVIGRLREVPVSCVRS